MSDPAVEAAQRVGFRDFPPKARGLAIDAAREAIQPIRQIHRAVDAHGTGRMVCAWCWNSMSHYASWPCATARLVYSTEELEQS